VCLQILNSSFVPNTSAIIQVFSECWQDQQSKVKLWRGLFLRQLSRSCSWGRDIVRLHFVGLHFVRLHFVRLHFVQLQFVQLRFVQLHFVQLHTICTTTLCLSTFWPSTICPSTLCPNSLGRTHVQLFNKEGTETFHLEQKIPTYILNLTITYQPKLTYVAIYPKLNYNLPA
jgi:hypothetical protein